MSKSGIYLMNNGAESVEKDRLDFQHRRVLIPLTKTLLPAHISKHLISLGRPPAVADVGSGTGIWLVDVARDLPSNARLDGFDIDASKFTEPGQLPSNVKLHVGNVLGPFPRELRGTYDLVHVRFLAYGLKAEEWVKAVANLRTLLRPGGWVFWEDTGHYSFAMLPETKNWYKWLSVDMQFALSAGRDILVPLHLGEQAKSVGFVNCTEETFSSFRLDKDGQKVMTQTLIAHARQTMHGIVDRGGLDWLQSHEAADGLVADMTEDMENGVRAGYTLHWITGQNPDV